MTVFNVIRWWFLIVAYFFGPPCILLDLRLLLGHFDIVTVISVLCVRYAVYQSIAVLVYCVAVTADLGRNSRCSYCQSRSIDFFSIYRTPCIVIKVRLVWCEQVSRPFVRICIALQGTHFVFFCGGFLVYFDSVLLMFAFEVILDVMIC